MNYGIHPYGIYGIYTDVQAERYHADALTDEPTFSRSIAHIILTRSPYHAWWAHPRLNPDCVEKASGTLDNGTAMHALLFEATHPVIVEADNWRTNAAQDARTEARREGKVALLAKDAKQIREMCEAISRQLDKLSCDPRPFTDGKAEQTLIWRDRGGVLCRARADWLRTDRTVIEDLKTTGTTASPQEWTRRRLWEDGLDLQAALYLRAIKTLAGAEAEFRFVVVENKPPYALSVISLQPAALELANAKLDKALDTWKHCLQTGKWPGYPTRIAYAELPPWEESRWLERQALQEMEGLPQ